MPKLDGISAAQRIAGQRIAPVVILTAFSQRDLVERARDAGAMAYLVKPFNKHDLVPAIEMAVSRFAELQMLEAEVADLTERLETRKAGRPREGRPAAAARAERARCVPMDPEDRDGPPALDAAGGRGGHRSRPFDRRRVSGETACLRPFRTSLRYRTVSHHEMTTTPVPIALRYPTRGGFGAKFLPSRRVVNAAPRARPLPSLPMTEASSFALPAPCAPPWCSRAHPWR